MLDVLVLDVYFGQDSLAINVFLLVEARVQYKTVIFI